MTQDSQQEDTLTQKFWMTARSGLAGMAVLGLAACSSGNSHPTTSAQPAASSVAPTAPVAQVTIRDVQSALQKDGYNKNGKIDGVWGSMTQRSVTRFQHDHNLTQTGKLDVPTLQALNLTGAPPSTNNSSADSTGSTSGAATPDNTAPGSPPAANPSTANPPSATGTQPNH